MWTVIAEGNPDEFEQNVSYTDDLPMGTRLRLEIDTTMPIAPLLDLWGAEWVAQKMLGDADVEVKDVHSAGWNKVIVDMEAEGAWPVIIAVAIIAIIVLGGIGWIVYNLRLMAEIAGPAGTTLLIVAGVAVLGLLGYAAYKTQAIERIPKLKGVRI